MNNNQNINNQINPQQQPQPMPNPVNPNVGPINNNQMNVNNPVPINPEPVENNPLGERQNKFINYDNNSNETSINSLNVEGTYNQLERPDYTNEPKVRQNMEEHKKNTVPVSKELKTVIVIALILLIFIIVMPMISDVINNIRFN